MPDGVHHGTRFIECCDGSSTRFVESPRAPPALVTAGFEPGREKFFSLESLKCSEHGPSGNLAVESSGYLTMHRAAIGGVAERDDCQENSLLKRPEGICHSAYIVCKLQAFG